MSFERWPYSALGFEGICVGDVGRREIERHAIAVSDSNAEHLTDHSLAQRDAIVRIWDDIVLHEQIKQPVFDVDAEGVHRPPKVEGSAVEAIATREDVLASRLVSLQVAAFLRANVGGFNFVGEFLAR